MARGVSDAPGPKVHQALHGYADGHRQLALSATLTPRDQKTLLAFSDISGPGARLEPEGYLTGYPLAESGYYALARTWAAPEMPRPGCVWTHTLLIAFTDLAGLNISSGHLEAFRRPESPASFSDYSNPTFFRRSTPYIWADGSAPWLQQVLAALYGKPRSRIVARRPSFSADELVLEIWSQQWPRLRRSFRFCTLATSDRSVDAASFDLQLLPGPDRSVRSRFSEAFDAENVVFEGGVWLDDAMRDLWAPDALGLRSFFRKLGSDVVVGREAFRPLCQLHRAVTAFANESNAVHDAIAILQDGLGKKQAKTARAVVARAALEVVDTLDDPSFEFLWSNLDLLDPEAVATEAGTLGRSTWRRDPKRLAQLPSDESALKAVVDRTVDSLELPALLEGLREAPELIDRAVWRRPELVGQSLFWSDLQVGDEPFRAATSSHLEVTAVTAMVEAGRSDLAFRSASEFGAKTVLLALKSVPEANNDRTFAWVQAAASDPNAVADFLAHENGIRRAMLVGLARLLPPDAVPNVDGADPWLMAWRSSVGGIDETTVSFLAAYFLSRALGTRSRTPGELAQLCFERTHHATTHNHLPEEGWRLVEPRLPWSPLWFEWDRSQRLRAGIASLFVDRDLPPSSFARLVADNQLFGAIAYEAARSSRGRKYLRHVREAMKSDSALADRARSLSKLLR